MEKEIVYSIISASIYLVGAIPFWRDIASERTIPHAFTYIAWCILVGINFIVLWGNHEWYTLIPNGLMLGSLVFATVFGLRAIRKLSLNWFDYLCFSLSIFLLIYWFLSKNNLHTVILTACVDFIAFLPTFKKGWLTPWTEIFLYTLGALLGKFLHYFLFQILKKERIGSFGLISFLLILPSFLWYHFEEFHFDDGAPFLNKIHMSYDPFAQTFSKNSG